MKRESPDMNQEAGLSRWKVLALLTVVLAIPQIVRALGLRLAGGNAWLMVGTIALWTICMIGLPLVARRRWPPLAGFDITWLPRRRWWLHLLAGVGLAALLILWSAAVRVTLQRYGMWQNPVRISAGNLTLLSPVAVLVLAAALILLGPIAEEFFWRGYVFGQLKKVSAWPVALAAQALLSSVVHMFALGPSVVVFGYGVLLGLWRQRKRSLIPIIMAHVLVNAVFWVPWAIENYRQAEQIELTEGTDFDVLQGYGDYLESVRNHPLTPKIDRAARKPPDKAIPALIEFLKEKDETPRTYTMGLLMGHFGNDVCPYLRDLLHSDNPHAVQSAVELVGFCKCDELADEVVELCLETEDTGLTISAICTLEILEDRRGLRTIASRYSNENLRKFARRCLEGLGQATGAEDEEP